jgi:hypothetical protein
LSSRCVSLDRVLLSTRSGLNSLSTFILTGARLQSLRSVHGLPALQIARVRSRPSLAFRSSFYWIPRTFALTLLGLCCSQDVEDASHGGSGLGAPHSHAGLRAGAGVPGARADGQSRPCPGQGQFLRSLSLGDQCVCSAASMLNGVVVSLRCRCACAAGWSCCDRAGSTC